MRNDRSDSGARARSLSAPLLVLALLATACTTGRSPPSAGGDATASTTPVGALTAAARKRVTFDQLLGERVALIAAVTAAQMAGPKAKLVAARGALDANTNDLADATATVLAMTPSAARTIWDQQVTTIIAYAKAAAKRDVIGRRRAEIMLRRSALTLAAAVRAAHASQNALDVGALETAAADHLAALVRIVDAQVGRDYQRVGMELDAAFDQADTLALLMVETLGLQGQADSDAAQLHSVLTRGFGEHVLAAAAATDATIGGRSAEFAGMASAWLDRNSRDLAAALARPLKKTPQQVYELWNNHIAMFTAYSQAAARGDTPGRSKAQADLDGYAGGFGALVGGAIPSLPADGIERLTNEHVATLIAVIDAQASKEYVKEFSSLRAAYRHMDMLGTVLALAVAG